MTSQPGILVVRSDLPESERRKRDGIIVTSIERSLLDLARTGDPDRTEDALRLRTTTPDRLVASVARSSYRRGQLAARKLVDELTDGPWSPPERRLHVALRGAKIAGWKANVGLVIGGRAVRPDVAFEELKLAVEIDGREQHSKAEVFESDRQRQNLPVLDGWTVLRFTWRQIRYQPGEVIAEILATLAMLRARAVR
jgi:very-short-patch-repair endonuclease